MKHSSIELYEISIRLHTWKVLIRREKFSVHAQLHLNNLISIDIFDNRHDLMEESVKVKKESQYKNFLKALLVLRMYNVTSKCNLDH